MKMTFLGAAGMVTGSSYLLEVAGKRYLVDAGEFQGSKDDIKRNYEPFKVLSSSIDAILITHAHIDHLGLIPRHVQMGFHNTIYATEATADLAAIQHEDSAKIHERETEKDNERAEEYNKRNKRGPRMPVRYPLFTLEDAKKAVELYKGVPYGQTLKINENVSATFYDAGHVLGSSHIVVDVNENGNQKRIVFGGDIGQKNTPIIRDPTILNSADYVLIESTYGGRLHDKPTEKKGMLLEILKEVYEKGGPLLTPSFAIERTQELLYYTNEFSNTDVMPNMSVYVDSPLASKATKIFSRHPECYDDDTRTLLANDNDPFSFPQLKFCDTAEDSKKLNWLKGPFWVIAGNGMCTAGRIRHHIKHHISNPDATILFVGYQAKGTTGDLIKSGAKKIKFYGEEYPVNATVYSIDGFSAHADQNGLLDWTSLLLSSKPKFIITHGEDEQRNSLEQKLREKGATTLVPRLYDSIEL